MFTVWVKEQRLDPLLNIETMHNITQKDFDKFIDAYAYADRTYSDGVCSYVSITAPVGNEKNAVLYVRSLNVLKTKEFLDEG